MAQWDAPSQPYCRCSNAKVLQTLSVRFDPFFRMKFER